jgi:tRNA(Ile)-lysidine synthase
MAHTADDQAETILHRILRGTGLRGLAGIPRIRPLGPATTIVRPLLGITRAQIIQYLAALGQDYRSDSTNELLHGTRNRIRRELIPHIETRYNPRFKAALLNLGRLAGEAQSLIDELVDEVLARALINRTETACQIDCGQLRAAPRYVVRECFIRIWQQQGWPRQSLDFEHLQLLADLVLAPGAGAFARQTLPGAVLARRGGDQLYLVRANPDA